MRKNKNPNYWAAQKLFSLRENFLFFGVLLFFFQNMGISQAKKIVEKRLFMIIIK